MIKHKNYIYFFYIFFVLTLDAKPRVSAITSVFNGDEFIIGFLEDIKKQTIFGDVEFILINANSPGHEDTVIKDFITSATNIIYIKLDYDPGLYAVWNKAIQIASADLITNLNLDDRRNPESLEQQAQALEEDPLIDLVYSSFYITYNPNETFECNNYRYVVEACEFSPQRMHQCLPGPQPMWRKTLHTNYGFFNEKFSSSGDWEMWLRAVSKGAQFKKIPGVSGLYYQNPQGVSTNMDAEKVQKRAQEDNLIVKLYQHVWH